MEIRRARPEDHEAVGEATVAAYEDFLTGAEDFYIAHLRDAASRDRDAEMWVAADERDGRGARRGDALSRELAVAGDRGG